MALSRSASGPSGLSINTSSANLFGSSSSQPPAPGALFGNTSAATKPSGLFGNTPSSSSSTTATLQPQQPGGGLFGSSSTATTQPQQTMSGLFGGGAASTATSQPQQQTGGLFGNTQPAQTQAQTQMQTQNQNTGGLFGGGTAGQTPSGGTGPTGGLFGGSLKPSQPAATTTGSGLFGQASQPKPSLFGSTLGQPAQSRANPLVQPQPQQSGLGLGGSLGLGLTMGQSSAQQAVPGVRIDVSNLKGTTRFNDLQEGLQKKIEQVDVFIQQQMQNKEQVDSFMPGHREMLESIPNDVNFVERKYEGARNALQSAAQAIEAARALVGQDVDHARLSFRAIDNLKLPEQYHTAGIWSPRQQPAGTANTEADGQDLVGFFSKAADEMEEQMGRYDGNMSEIEMHMHGVSDSLVEQLQKMMASKNGAPSGPDEKIRELGIVFREFEQGILKVASDVASAREGMTRLQLGEFVNNDGNRNGVY